MSTKKKNMDVYLAEVYKQFIAIKDDDFKKSQEVFKNVFDQVKKKMEEKCNYFAKYSSQIMYAGSVYDDIKVSKLDEFDMDIVIRLPINYDTAIDIENDQAGFVKLKVGEQFDHLDKQPDWEKCHKATRDWRDQEKYLLQNKFRQWLHGLVQKAVNELDEKVDVNGTVYLLKYKESGPAFTLKIRNQEGDEEFVLDVDLVPVIRFLHPRWPEGYRTLKDVSVKDWLVVPKPNKAVANEKLKNRCWRLSFQDFERQMLKRCMQLKPTIRLVKKLRDSLELKQIASYYIKTLFLWKIDEMKDDKKFWQQKLSVLFGIMVEELHKAIEKKKIPYFWKKENNLIESLKPTHQKLFTEKLHAVIVCIHSNDVDKLVEYLLNANELREFKTTEFYQTRQSIVPNSVSTPRQASPKSITVSDSSTEDPCYMSLLYDRMLLMENNIKKLEKLVTTLTEKVEKLEREKELSEAMSNLNLSNACNIDLLTM